MVLRQDDCRSLTKGWRLWTTRSSRGAWGRGAAQVSSHPPGAAASYCHRSSRHSSRSSQAALGNHTHPAAMRFPKGDRIGNHSHPVTHIAILLISYMNTQLHKDESRDEQEDGRQRKQDEGYHEGRGRLRPRIDDRTGQRAEVRNGMCQGLLSG